MGIPGAFRPRTNSELFDASFAVLRLFAGKLMPLSLALGLPLMLIRWWTHPAGHRHGGHHFALDWLAVFALAEIRGWLLEAAIIEGLTTGEVRWAAARKRVRAVLWPLIWRTVAFWFFVALGLIAFVIPGVEYYLSQRFFAEVLLVEGRPATVSAAAIRATPFERSAALARGALGSTAAAVFGLWVLLLPLVFGLQGWLPKPWSRLALWLLSGCFSVAEAAFYVLLYYNRRAVREGLDLAEREAALEAHTGAAARAL